MKCSKLIFLSILFSAALLQGCWNDEPDPVQKSEEELALEALTGAGSLTWTVSGGGAVKRDGTAVTDLYNTFELTLSANSSSKTYTSKNSNELFANAGTWSFVGDNFDKITLSGTSPASAREISYTRNGDNLKLLFSIPLPGGRTNAVVGNYEFDLLKK
ncbi:hypothetical protein JYB64_13185 [Algoriphagus aestuarii]|nr:hypothetical protein [Algoriphagus aestuarii]